MTILIVRLGALGDIIHTIPAAAALRRRFPAARIDWAVDARHAPLVELVTGIDRVVPLHGRSAGAWVRLVRELRPVQYDVALDFQGLMKSAVIARASGAARVIGFSIWHLREKTARPFYSEVEPGGEKGSRQKGEGSRHKTEGGQEAGTFTHVIEKNLRMTTVLGVTDMSIEFPLRPVPSAARDDVVRQADGRPIALLNPGAAWPNKRWPVARFGEVAAFLREVHGMQPWVVWGPGEDTLGRDVVEASGGAAQLAPPTTTLDLLELCRHAALMVSGDTGPLHVAGAVGTPLVAIFGPTSPARNGPWSPDDVVVSRYEACGCSYRRRCTRPDWCLLGVAVPEVTAAIQRRLAAVRGA